MKKDLKGRRKGDKQIASVPVMKYSIVSGYLNVWTYGWYIGVILNIKRLYDILED